MSFIDDFNDALTEINSAVGDPISYRKISGEVVSGYAFISEQADSVSYESAAVEYRHEIRLQRSVYGLPARGDVVINTDTGINYEVADLLPGGDELESIVSARKVE